MSPLYADPFKGHMPLGDPRNPLTAAGGCTWPTVPAYRYWLISDDATEELAFFNTSPVLLEFEGLQPSHNYAKWILVPPHAFVLAAMAEKRYWPREPIYRWHFEIQVDELPLRPLRFSIERSVETCNRDLPLPNVTAFPPESGETGDTFRMEQIVWDQSSPPP